MSITDIHGHIVYVNKTFVETSGYGYEELLGHPHNVVRHPDMPPALFADMWGTLQAGQPWSGILKNRRKNGDHYWVRANVTPIVRAGVPVGYMSVRTKPHTEEVAQAKRIYQRFEDSDNPGVSFYRGIALRTGGWLGWVSQLRHASVYARVRVATLLAAVLPVTGVLVAEASGTPAAIGVLAGALLGALMGARMLDRQVARPLIRLLKHAQKVASGQPDRSINLDRADEIGMIMRAINQSGLNLLALLDDVAGFDSAANLPDSFSDDRRVSPRVMGDTLWQTEIGRIAWAFSKLELNLHIDKLTGINNRAFLIERFDALKRQVRREGPRPGLAHALLFIDLDGFKPINDEYGHGAGDDVLVIIAARLKKLVRAEDVLARYGGDEFCILLGGVNNAEDVALVTEKIAQAIEQPIKLSQGLVHTSASIGWALFPTDSEDFDALLHLADHRMLQAKRERPDRAQRSRAA